MLATSTTTAANPIRIVIADDHPCIIDGMRFALRKHRHIKIAGHAANGEELLAIVAQEQPDIVFTDIEMPVMNGITATKIIRERYPHIKVIGFSSFNTDDYITDMIIDAKASGYILKGAGPKEILEAIEKVMNGGICCSEEVSAKILRLAQQTNSNPNKPFERPVFTDRQLLVLKETANELSCKEIAQKHNLPLSSVESAKKELLRKTGRRNSAGLALYAARYKITQL